MKINTDSLLLPADLAKSAGRATTRLLTASEIMAFARDAEQQFDRLHIPLAIRGGATIDTLPERPPNAYHYSCESDRATLTRGCKGWFMTSLRRAKVWACPHGQAARLGKVQLTAAQADHVIAPNLSVADRVAQRERAAATPAPVAPAT